jgi:hypothetical protein
MRLPFFGAGSYLLDSPNASADVCIGLIPEVIESKVGRAVGRMKGTPGLTLLGTLPQSNVLALWSGQDRLFAVAGTTPSHLYEVFADGSCSDHGPVGNALYTPFATLANPEYQPALIFPNASGSQLMVINGGFVWVDSGTGAVPINFSIPMVGLQIDDTGNGLINGTGFGPTDVGATMEIQSGIGFTIQSQVITSTGSSTLNGAAVTGVAFAAAAWGTADSIGGTGIEVLGAQAYTDLYTLAPGWFVGSKSYQFTQADIGRTLVITGGSGWVHGTYLISGWGLGGPQSGTVLLTQNGLPAAAAPPNTSGGSGTEETGGQVPAGTGAYLDTYGIIAAPQSNQWYISGIDDFTSFNPIDEADKEAYPDHILAFLADHELLWIFGGLESTEIWQDTGAANFPFQRLQAGGVIHYGLAAQFSPVRLSINGIAWMAFASSRGDVQAVYCQGLMPQRISTHAIEEAWRTYPTVEDAIGYTEIDEGHEFWVLHFPQGDATWVFDFTAWQQTGIPQWHQRGYWDGTTLHRQLQRCHAFGDLYGHGSAPAISGAHFVGDHTSGNIYIQSLSTPSDNGHAIFRQRACPHVAGDNQRFFYGLFQLEMDVGEQDVTVTFDYSKDHGHTFMNAQSLIAPAAPNVNAPNVSGYSTRLRWRRLGWAWDLVPRITIISATAPISITNAFMDGEPGGE